MARALVVLLAVVAGCKGDDDGGPGPGSADETSDTASSELDCEASGVRYDTFAQPLLATWCTPCHSSELPEGERSGAPVGLDFDSYDNVVALGTQIASSIAEERMPPVGGLTPEERDTFVAWVDCGMPRGDVPEPETAMCEAPVAVGPGEVDCSDAGQAAGVTVTGTLEASGTLDCVCAVQGDLRPTGAVQMASLSQVDGQVLLTSGEAVLPGLVEVGALTVEGPAVGEVQLDGLEVVHGDVQVIDTALLRFDLPRLDVVEGELVATGNRQLTDGLRFANVTVVQGSARFEDNDALAMQVLFGHLERFDGDIVVSGNDALESLVGLGQLEALGGRLLVQENPALELVNVGIHLESIGGGLAFLGNPELTLVETFPALTSVGLSGTFDPDEPSSTALYLAGNSTLEAFTALPAVEALGGLYIGGHLRLAQVGPFPALASIGGVSIEGTREMPQPPALGSVTAVSGPVRIEATRNMVSLGSWMPLTSIGGDLVIVDNRDLRTVVAQAFADAVNVGGATVITGNP